MSIVEVQGLRKSYGAITAVDDVGFAVAEGEIFGILGLSGAGKTTAVERVEGLRVPDAGRIRVAGFDPIREHDEVIRILGVQLQECELQAKLTVREALEMYSAFYERPADWQPLVECLGIEEQLGQRFGKLSGGQNNGCSSCSAWWAKVVVCDELTAALDPRARRETWQPVPVRSCCGLRPGQGRGARHPGWADQELGQRGRDLVLVVHPDVSTRQGCRA